MLETRDRTLQIDATIELKDYFQAYFDSAKTRLIVACLVVAALIALFVYFFMLIDEQKILWQLSPLFFGMPIVAVGGQFLRVHASYRKYIRDIPESQRSLYYIFHEAGDGFDVMRGKSFIHVAWDDVRKVIERPRYFRFDLSRYESVIIPKRFLAHGSDEQVMKEILVSTVGHKAKLLS
jgi:YcxB-like protein